VVNAAVGDTGDALVEWESRAYGTTGAHVALARPGAGFVDEETLSRRAGRVVMAVGAGGTAFVAAEDRRTFKVRTFGAGSNTLLRPLRTLRCQRAEGLAIGRDGRILLACGHRKELWAWEGYAFLRRTERLSRGREQVDTPVDVSLDRGGRALVTWEERVTRARTALRAAVRERGRFKATTLTGRHESVYPGGALLLPGDRGALVLGGFDDIGKRSGSFSVRYSPDGGG
jgi:hypothetical protein